MSPRWKGSGVVDLYSVFSGGDGEGEGRVGGDGEGRVSGERRRGGGASVP